jgi:hypothetical protein
VQGEEQEGTVSKLGLGEIKMRVLEIGLTFPKPKINLTAGDLMPI